jgi:spermidine/putrescine transport system substrate-binding protein
MPALRRWLLLLILPLAACSGGPEVEPVVEQFGLRVETSDLSPTLRLFNFPDYLDPELIREFRETYGVRIVQDFFDTNEAMLARVQAGGSAQFDLIVASDYAVQILAAGGHLADLDPALLPNRAHLHPRFVGLPYDPESRYSVPYQWGTTGIGVRGDRVSGDPDTLATWGLLFDPAMHPGRFALLDDPRETIGAALLYLGYSVNTTDPGALSEARRILEGARDRALAFTPATTGRDLLVAGELDLVHNHSGDIEVAREEREAIRYLIPREGAVLWADNLVLPAGSPNAYTAQVFINFLLDPERGAQLTNEIRYASPNQSAWPYLDEELRAVHEDLVEGGLIDRLEFIEDVGVERRLFDQLWTELKAGAGR